MLQVKSALGIQSPNLFLYQRLGQGWCHDAKCVGLVGVVLRGSMAVGSGDDWGRVVWSGLGLRLRPRPFFGGAQTSAVADSGPGLLLPVPGCDGRATGRREVTGTVATSTMFCISAALSHTRPLQARLHRRLTWKEPDNDLYEVE